MNRWIVVGLIVASATVSGQKPAPPLPLNGGDHQMYIGTYAGSIQIFDEATEKMSGEIKLQTGIQSVNMEDRAADGGVYSGVSWTTGIRVGW